MKYKSLKSFHILFALWLCTSLWGAFNVFSAESIEAITLGSNPYIILIQQLIYIFITSFVFYVMMKRPKKTEQIVMYFTNSFMYFIIACLAILVFFGPLLSGTPLEILIPSRGGAYSVVNLLVIDFQPMEFFKIVVILYISLIYSKNVHKLDGKSIWKTFLAPGIGLFLILLEPDLGGTIIVFATIAIMFFLKGDFKGRQVLYGILAIVSGAILFVIAILFDVIQSYQIDRVTSWLFPFNDPTDTGVQLIDSFVAISNGGISGSGFMNSIQKASMFATESDTIFSVILEEWGIIGLVFTSLILFSIGSLCIYIGFNSKKRYRQIFCYAMGSLILIQSFVNMGGVTGVIPFTGVTLPFISNGINSFFSLSCGLFFVCVMGKNDYIKQQEDLKEKL